MAGRAEHSGRVRAKKTGYSGGCSRRHVTASGVTLQLYSCGFYRNSTRLFTIAPRHGALDLSRIQSQLVITVTRVRPRTSRGNVSD